MSSNLPDDIRPPKRQKTGHKYVQPGPRGFMTNASDFVINQPTMIDMNRAHIIHNISTGRTVLEHLLPYTCQDAAVDSSARDPPPRCHPGTRQRIAERLNEWVNDENRQWNAVWVYGPAGAGKSAVAQTFAEQCAEEGRLGAAYFFSRLGERDDPKTVIPTLAYQLAVSFADYKHLLTDRLSSDPAILQKSPRVQFKKLIAEPFSTLHARGPPSKQDPFLIIIDGLDECKEEDTQCEFVRMINGLKKDLPLIWLISSRPEPHLKYIFLRTDSNFGVNCGREELVIDAKSREDVDRYLRDGFKDIRAKFWDVTGTSWPSEEQLGEVSRAASGLFIFASTVLRFVGDSETANPASRLNAFLSFVNGTSKFETGNPLRNLDLFYTQIISDVADDVLPTTTKRILACCLFCRDPAQVVANILSLDQSTFYGALRRLHSVTDIPAPEDAAKKPLSYYHKSFNDYLLDPARSGNFSIEMNSARTDVAKLQLYWLEQCQARYGHETDGWDVTDTQGPLPGLTWVLSGNNMEVSRGVAMTAQPAWRLCRDQNSLEHIPELLSQVHLFNFGVIRAINPDLPAFMTWLWQHDPETGIIRTVPRNPIDDKLLGYLVMMTHSEATTNPVPLEPMAIHELNMEPTGDHTRMKRYLFIGNDEKASIFCISKATSHVRLDMLGHRDPPSRESITEYHNWLVEANWYGGEKSLTSQVFNTKNFYYSLGSCSIVASSTG